MLMQRLLTPDPWTQCRVLECFESHSVLVKVNVWALRSFGTKDFCILEVWAFGLEISPLLVGLGVVATDISRMSPSKPTP